MTDTDRKRKKYLYALFKKNGSPRSFVQSTLRNCEANQKKRKEVKSEEKKKKELQMIDTDRKGTKCLYALFEKNGYPRSFVQSTPWYCDANQKKRKEVKSEEKKKKELQDMVV